MWPFASRRNKPLQRVGIVLAAYQPDQQLFEGQLESIRAQDHPDWFCVITMDSPMLTVSEAPWIRRFYEDGRFHFFQNDTQLGVPKNFERGSHIALNLGAEAIAFSDQDDLWYATKISRSLLALNQQPRLSAVCCDARVRLDGVLLPHLRSHYQDAYNGILSARRILFSWGAWGNGMVFDADLTTVHPFDSITHTNHDSKICIVASLNGGISFLPETLFEYNLHESNYAGINKLQKRKLDNRAFRNQAKLFLGQWSRSRRVLQNSSWRYALLRFLLSTYASTMALICVMIVEDKFQNGTRSNTLKMKIRYGAWLFRRWIILRMRMRIYSLLFSRRRSAPRRQS